MKKLVLLSFLMIHFLPCFSQLLKKERGHVLFKVSEVDLAKNKLEEYTKDSVLEKHIDARIESYSLFNRSQNLVPTKMHGVIEALHYCFAQHRPISISPDIIWLMICQGVAQHIEANAEALRNKIVRHEGKKEIHIRRNDFAKGNKNNPWHEVFPVFVDSIKKYVKTNFYENINTTYTTTNEEAQIAFQITLMSCVNSYFDFWTDTECGIPEFEITGTTKDWVKIKRKVEKLRFLGLDDWIDELMPIIQQFIQASKGKIDKEFWKSIYKLNEDCSDIYVRGWIMKFFPYCYNDENLLVQNKSLKKDYSCNLIKFNTIPGGISKADFKWCCHPSEQLQADTFNMEFCAGFIGIEQNKQTKMLKPNISWFVKEKDAKKLINKKDVEYVVLYESVDSSESEEIFIELTDFKKNKESLTAIERIRLDEDCIDYGGTIFTVVERMPLFNPINCKTEEESKKALRNYIRKELSKIKNKVSYEGEVLVKFVVTKTGAIDNVSIIKSNAIELNKDIIDIVKNMPRWQPGAQRGRNVPVWYHLPIIIKK